MPHNIAAKTINCKYMSDSKHYKLLVLIDMQFVTKVCSMIWYWIAVSDTLQRVSIHKYRYLVIHKLPVLLKNKNNHPSSRFLSRPYPKFKLRDVLWGLSTDLNDL